jgi:hypothetical protein
MLCAKRPVLLSYSKFANMALKITLKYDSSFVQLCKRESFEIIWNELFNPVVEIYLSTDNKGLEIHFPRDQNSLATGNRKS